MATRVGHLARRRGGAQIDDWKIEMEQRIKTIEDGQADLTAAVTEIKTNTADILAAIKGASFVGQIVRKHGPRVVAFSIGLLVASGHVSAEVAQQFLQLFGLS